MENWIDLCCDEIRNIYEMPNFNFQKGNNGKELTTIDVYEIGHLINKYSNDTLFVEVEDVELLKSNINIIFNNMEKNYMLDYYHNKDNEIRWVLLNSGSKYMLEPAIESNTNVITHEDELKCKDLEFRLYNTLPNLYLCYYKEKYKPLLYI